MESNEESNYISKVNKAIIIKQTTLSEELTSEVENFPNKI